MQEEFLRNRPFDKIHIGDTASLVRIMGRDDIDLFAAVSGEVSPADAPFAKTDLFGHIVAHGMWTSALVHLKRRAGPDGRCNSHRSGPSNRMATVQAARRLASTA